MSGGGAESRAAAGRREDRAGVRPAAPAVSVVMPVRDAGRYLDEALDSLWAQTWRDFEVVAVDDGSVDGSGRRLAEVAAGEARLRVLSMRGEGVAGARGVTAALNHGVSAARGALVARMDADDRCAPGRLSAQVAYLAAHPEVVAVGGGLTLIDADGDRLEEHPYPETHEQILERLEAGRSGLSHPAAMIRAEALHRVVGYDPGYATAQDFDLWLRLSTVGRLANLPETVLAYRLHGRSVGGRRRPEQREAVARALRAHAQRTGRPMGQADEPAGRGRVIDPRLGWARAALRGGEVGTARKHAEALRRARPWALSSWVVGWRVWRAGGGGG